MPTISELPIPNLFLASLPQDDFEALRPHFERVRLSSGQILHKPKRLVCSARLTRRGCQVDAITFRCANTIRPRPACC